MKHLSVVNTETMTSTQLAEMLGFESKSSINSAIRKMFDDSQMKSSKDTRGYVVDYHLSELQSKMFVAKHDINYLEMITKYWIDSHKKAPTNYIEALEALVISEKEKQIAIETKAEIGSRREATAMNTASQATKKANKLEIELDKAKEYCTIKRMEMIQHGQRFNWRILKDAQQNMGIDSIDVFDANYGTVKAYHVSVWKESYGVTIND